MAQHVIPSPITSSGIDSSGASRKKGWEAIIWEGAKSIPDYISMLLTKRSYDAKTGTLPVFAGIPAAAPWDAVSTIPKRSIGKLGEVTFDQTTYANGVEYTFEAGLWDIYNIANDKKAHGLGLSLQDKRQRLFADWINALQTNTSYDGAAIISASHPYDARYSAGYQSNYAGAVLSITSLRAALQAAQAIRDPFGRQMSRTPAKLVVADTKVSEALEILNVGMGLKSGTANNDRNPFKQWNLGQDSVVPFPYFTNANSWFLTFSDAELHYLEKRPITLFPPRDNEAHGVSQDGYFTLGFYAASWTGIYGYIA